MQMTDARKAKRDALAARLDNMAKPPPAIEKAAATVDAALAEWRAEAAQLRTEIEILDAQLGVSEPIDPAIAATARARRAADAHAREQTWNDNWKAVLDLEAQRLKAIDDAQQAAEALRDAIALTLAVNERIAKVYANLAAVRFTPGVLNPRDAADRLGNRICATLATLKNCRGMLGGLTWRSSGDRWRHPSWAGDEERRMGRTLIDLAKEKV